MTHLGSGRILQHVSTSLTGEKVNLGDFNQVAGDKGTIIKLHASLMILAWFLCANLGTFVAKYCKDMFMVSINRDGYGTFGNYKVKPKLRMSRFL